MGEPSQGTKTAAQKAFEADQARQMQAYYQTAALVNADAYRTAEAQQRIALEQLRTDAERKTEKVKQLKEKALLVSAENVSKQELVDSMGERLSELSAELSRLTLIQTRQQKMGRTEDEKEAALRTIFEATMERAVTRRNDAGPSQFLQQQQQQQQQQQVGLPTQTSVYCCPGGESKAGALATAVFRLGKATTFREITANAARYFGLPPERCLLEDDNHTLWPLDVVVTREIARYRGDQVLRLVLREENDMRLLGGGAGGGMDDEEELGTSQLMKMLNSGGGGGGGGEGGMEGEMGDEEAEQQAAMEALAAMADEESDSDDDADKRKEYVEPPLNYRREYKEFVIHGVFLTLLIMSTTQKRTIADANSLYNALETIFVEEEFGDYNEKAFMDVRNFEEAWEWTEGVLGPGLFESDVDETGNIMMYNQLVGAVRLRQQRVSNESCVLSWRVQQMVRLGDDGDPFKYSFYFHKMGSGGGCFAEYRKELRDETSYGPCTEEGRELLAGIPDVDKYNESCKDSGFEWSDAETTRALPVTFNDASGFVRDIESDEPPEGRDTPRLPPQRFYDTIDELKSFLWLDEYTRSYIASFSVYNANFNLYCACTFIFHFTAGGVIMPSYRFKVMKLELYENLEEISAAFNSLEVLYDFLVNMLVLRLLIKELAQYLYIRCTYGTSLPYLTNIWNMLEVMNITPFFFAWGVRISFVLDPNRMLYKAGMFATRYAEIATSAQSYSTGFNFDSISILVSFLKLFKYFRLSQSLKLLWEVLSRAATDTISFAFMLILFLIGFAIFAEQYFGLTQLVFSDLISSMTALLQMIFGVVDIYWDMTSSQSQGIYRITAISFFITYTTWMFFILVNVFLAILNDSYGQVKGELDEEKALKLAEREERIAAGLEERSSMEKRIRNARDAALKRMQRYRGQLKRIGKRRKRGQTTQEAIQAGTALGMTFEQVEELEKIAAERRSILSLPTLRRRRNNRVGASDARATSTTRA